METMMKVYLVWNKGKTECVGFTDRHDAHFAATGKRHPLSIGVSTLADEFRDIFDETKRQDKKFEKTEHEL